MSTDAEIIEYRNDGQVGILTMRFAPHNLVGKQLCGALIAALHKAHADGCRALVLNSGLRHFSAGADLGLFENHGERMHELDATGVLRAFDELPIPVVASVHGVALGGGFELALACDIIIASASSKFGLVEATLGLHPLMGGLQRVMQRAGAARAKEIVMMGRRHDAGTLEKWGIVNRVVADAQLHEVSLSIARELAQGPTVAHAATKRLSNIYLDQGMRACDDMMQEVQKPIFASGDLQRGLDSFNAAGPGNAVFHGN
jgi:enoyl-CoA hydratase/carnithine racemase